MILIVSFDVKKQGNEIEWILYVSTTKDSQDPAWLEPVAEVQ